MVQAGARAAALVDTGRGSGYGLGYWEEEEDTGSDRMASPLPSFYKPTEAAE